MFKECKENPDSPDSFGNLNWDYIICHSGIIKEIYGIIEGRDDISHNCSHRFAIHGEKGRKIDSELFND